jgi:hypothetical protein
MYTGWTLHYWCSPWDPSFSEQRRIARKAVGPTATPKYDTLIQEHIATFLWELPTTSGDPFDAITPFILHLATLHLHGSVGETIAMGATSMRVTETP